MLVLSVDSVFLGALQLCLENRRPFLKNKKRQQLDAPEIFEGPVKDHGQGRWGADGVVCKLDLWGFLNFQAQV